MFTPTNQQLGRVNVGEQFQFTITYQNMLNPPESLNIQLRSFNTPASVSLIDGAIAIVRGVVDGSVFDQTFIKWVEKDLVTIGQTPGWSGIPLTRVHEIVQFYPDPRTSIDYQITARASDGSTKIYTITVVRPDFSTDRDMLTSYLKKTTR
jgi:hypothetical protein